MVRPRRVDFLFLLFFLFKSKSKPHVFFFHASFPSVFFVFTVWRKKEIQKRGRKGECWEERERLEKREKKRFFLSFSLSLFLSFISRLALGRGRGKLETPVLPSRPRSSRSSMLSISVTIAHLVEPPPPFSRSSLPAVEGHEERTSCEPQGRSDGVRRGVTQGGPPRPPLAEVAHLLQGTPEKGQESSGEEALLSCRRGRKRRRTRSFFYDGERSEEKPGPCEREAERDVFELVRGNPRIVVSRNRRGHLEC